MLSSAVIRILSDQRLVRARALRLFLKIMADVDLTEYAVIMPGRYGMSATEARHYLSQLVKAGIMQRGPAIRGMSTYRLNPKMLLPEAERAQLQEQGRARGEREMLANPR